MQRLSPYATDIQTAMISPECGSYDLLENTLTLNDREILRAVLNILHCVSNAVHSSPTFEVRVVQYLPALVEIIVEDKAEIRKIGLAIALILSHSTACKMVMVTPELGFVSYLLKLLDHFDLDADLASTALDILVNISDSAENHLLSSIFTITALLSNDKVTQNFEMMIKVLSIVSYLSFNAKNHTLLAYSELGLVSFLNSFVAECCDEEILQMSTDILSKLALAIAVQAASEKVSVEYGVNLELFVACLQYKLNAVDSRMKMAGEKGLVGMKAFNQAKMDKTKMESDFAFALSVASTLPQDFMSLDAPATQAHWIKHRLNAHSVQLMSLSNDVQLAAFERFVCDLPSELQGAAEVPFAVITESSVLPDHQSHDCIVVNGLYHDGPITTVVKIKLRSIASNAMVQHEYNMLEKFHKHAPSAVVTPFAMVSTTDR